MSKDIKLMITVDTEADDQWKRQDHISVNNIEGLKRFQALCQKYNFKPTYLVSYEVAADVQAATILKSLVAKGRAEIGAHLHPWSTPPAAPSDIDQAFPSELTDQELNDKFKALTEVIERQFQTKPLSYRSGRWGMDERQFKLLKQYGYKVDCSITPKVSWTRIKGLEGGSGGPDFSLAPVRPYYTSGEQMYVGGDSSDILEVPMSILFTGLWSKENSRLAKLYLKFRTDSIIKKVFNRLLFRQKWLRIFPETTVNDFKVVYSSAVKNNLPALEFMIHSSELVAGGSPYVKTDQDLERVYETLESFFKFLTTEHVKGQTLSEFALDYRH